MQGVEFILSGETALIARIETTSTRLEAEIIRGLDIADTQMVRHVQQDKLQGQVLKSHTQNLVRNILRIDAKAADGTVTGGMGLGANAPYGLVHEFGGTFNIAEHLAHRIHGSNGRRIGAKGAHILKGNREGLGLVGVWTVREHSATFPERSFMRTGFADFQTKLEDSIRASIAKAAQ